MSLKKVYEEKNIVICKIKRALAEFCKNFCIRFMQCAVGLLFMQLIGNGFA